MTATRSVDVEAYEAIDAVDLPEDVDALDALGGVHECIATVVAGSTARVDVGVTHGGRADGLIRVWGVDSDGAVFVLRVRAGGAVKLRRALDRAIASIDTGLSEPRRYVCPPDPAPRPGVPRGTTTPTLRKRPA